VINYNHLHVPKTNVFSVVLKSIPIKYIFFKVYLNLNLHLCVNYNKMNTNNFSHKKTIFFKIILL